MTARCVVSHSAPSVLSQLAGLGVGVLAIFLVTALLCWAISVWESRH